MKLSVYIASCGRAELLRKCLVSVLAALPDEAEVIVALNGPQPRPTIEHPALRVLRLEKEPRAACRNRAFDECRGEIIHFLDDDVEVPPRLFREAIARFDADPSLAVLGGPNLTPPASPWIEHLFGAVLTSSFAAPKVRRRYGGRPGADRVATDHELILCNLALRRARFEGHMRFVGNLRSNEENLLLYACAAEKFRIVASPAMYVYHARRPRLSSFLQQIYTYGYGRFQQTAIAPRSYHPIFALPPIALVAALASFAWPVVALVAVVAHQLLALGGAIASPELRRRGVGAVLAAVPLTALVHLAYAIGQWSAALAHVGCPRLERMIPFRSCPSTTLK